MQIATERLAHHYHQRRCEFVSEERLGDWRLKLYGLARPGFLAIATNVFALFAIQAVLAFYAVLWVVLGLDTLRVIRLVRLPSAVRIAVATVAIAAVVAAKSP